jgi:hypothetical protein
MLNTLAWIGLFVIVGIILFLGFVEPKVDDNLKHKN